MKPMHAEPHHSLRYDSGVGQHSFLDAHVSPKATGGWIGLGVFARRIKELVMDFDS